MATEPKDLVLELLRQVRAEIAESRGVVLNEIAEQRRDVLELRRRVGLLVGSKSSVSQRLKGEKRHYTIVVNLPQPVP